MAPDIAESCRYRLFHDVSELAGHDQALTARHLSRFHEEDVAAYRRPCKADRGAGSEVALQDLFMLEAGRAESEFDELLVHHHLRLSAVGKKLRGLADHRSDLPLQVADAGFAGVEPN